MANGGSASHAGGKVMIMRAPPVLECQPSRGGRRSRMADRQSLLAEIERTGRNPCLLSGFRSREKSEPPGDTREAAAHLCKFLDRKQLPYKVIAPMDSMPNVVGSFEALAPGRHLVLNGHVDVFPVGDGAAGGGSVGRHAVWRPRFRPRRLRHEGGHHSLAFHVLLSLTAARGPQRSADLTRCRTRRRSGHGVRATSWRSILRCMAIAC